ncbi:MAG TPA: HNH endonuclease [Pirellulaceae bacterium]|nr:HNH endonuclease [Pirellulaceae bacterium]
MLVLNRHYVAVHVITARRAISLVYREYAEIIHIEEGQYANYDFESWRAISELRALEKHYLDDWIQSVHFELQVPRVIRLLSYERVPRQSLRFNRRNLFARDGHKCQYCGRSLPSHQMSLDHVVPRSRGGEMSWENIVCSCVDCNTRKGGRTPQEARMKLMSVPKKPKHNPLLSAKLNNPKYEVWKTFLHSASGLLDVG